MGARGIGAKPATARPGRSPAPPRRTGRHPALTRAQAVVAFLESLTITSGALAGTKLVLRPWQRRVVEDTYASDPDGRRPVRTVVISTARKSGKSTFCAGLALVHLVGPESRRRGQIVCCAADRPQASLIFTEVMAFAMADVNLHSRLIFRSHNKSVEDTTTGSTLTSLSSDASKAHGLSPTVAICDEVAQWKSRALLDAVQTGTGAHAEPLMLVISTRSVDPDSPLEELIRYGRDVADGTITDPGFRSYVYSAPADADPFSREAWDAANPDMTPERLADIESQVRQAKRLPSMLPAFQAYCCNMPVALDARFIAPGDWDACAGTAEAKGPCFGGLDLAGGASDLCAFALFWPETKLLRSWAFIPAGRIDTSELTDRAAYRQWAAAGHVVITPGRAIDRIWLAEWIATTTEALELVTIATDRWMLENLKQDMDREGISLPLEPHGQGYQSMSPAIAAFEVLVLDGRLRHAANPLLRWSVANGSIEMDAAGNRKLSKLRSRGRIDPVIASVMAISVASKQPAECTFERSGWLAV